MTDERLKEIIDDIISGRVVKITEKECEEISWHYEIIPPNCSTIILTLKHKNNK